MAITPEVQAKVMLWRQKAMAGTLSLEEAREAIQFLRQDRVSAAAASNTSRTKRVAAGKPIPNADDMLKELEG